MCVCIVGSLFSWIWFWVWLVVEWSSQYTQEKKQQRDDGEPGDDSTEDSGVLGRGRRQISSTGRTGGTVYQRSAAPNTTVDVDGVVQHGRFEA